MTGARRRIADDRQLRAVLLVVVVVSSIAEGRVVRRAAQPLKKAECDTVGEEEGAAAQNGDVYAGWLTDEQVGWLLTAGRQLIADDVILVLHRGKGGF